MNPPDKPYQNIDTIPEFPERTTVSTVAEFAGNPEVEFPCELIFSTDSPLVVIVRLYQDEEKYVDWHTSLDDFSEASDGGRAQVSSVKELNFWRASDDSSVPVVVGEITHDGGVVLQEPFRFILQHDIVCQFLSEVRRSKERAPLREEDIIDMMTERAIADALRRGL